MTQATERTCEDKRQAEIEKSLLAKECPDPGQFHQHFFKGFHEDTCSIERSNVYYLYCIPTCNPGNNEGEICCGCDVEWTGCHDPSKCDNRNCGIGYSNLAREYVRTSSMAYIPIKGELVQGGVFVYDENAMPDNQPANCDPCVETVVGAFCIVSLDELVNARVNAILEERGL